MHKSIKLFLASSLTFASFALTLIGTSYAESSLRLSAYPTNSETKKILKSDVTYILIQSFFNPGKKDSRVGYPGPQDFRNLNDLKQAEIDLYIDASSYPSTPAATRINNLGEHVGVDMTIRQCLLYPSNVQRLEKIEIVAQVHIYCPTAKATDKAIALLAKLREKNKMENLKIDIQQVPSIGGIPIPEPSYEGNYSSEENLE